MRMLIGGIFVGALAALVVILVVLVALEAPAVCLAAPLIELHPAREVVMLLLLVLIVKLLWPTQHLLVLVVLPLAHLVAELLVDYLLDCLVAAVDLSHLVAVQ